MVPLMKLFVQRKISAANGFGEEHQSSYSRPTANTSEAANDPVE